MDMMGSAMFDGESPACVVDGNATDEAMLDATLDATEETTGVANIEQQ
jgi:hypothetical protein